MTIFTRAGTKGRDFETTYGCSFFFFLTSPLLSADKLINLIIFSNVVLLRLMLSVRQDCPGLILFGRISALYGSGRTPG